MTTAQGGDAPLSRWVKHVRGMTHRTVVVTVAWAVRCLLVAQRITPAALARALPSEPAGAGRSCRRRVRRWWRGPVLAQTTMSPALIRLALTRLAGAPPGVVARDHDPPRRLGSLVGWQRRGGPPTADWLGRHPLPVAHRPRPDVAGRLPARDALELGRGPWLAVCGARCPTAPKGDGLPRAATLAGLGHGGGRVCDGGWARGSGAAGRRAADRRGPRPRAPRAAVGAGLDRRERRRYGPAQADPRHGARTGHASQSACPAPCPPAGAHDHTTERHGAALCADLGALPDRTDGGSSGSRVCAAHADRRDVPRLAPRLGGRAAVVKLPAAVMGERLSGVVYLTYHLQMELGPRVSVAPIGQQRRAPWTVTNRGSWFWGGQRLWADPGDDGRGWLAQQGESVGQREAAVQATPRPEPALEEAA
jgi:hypothetical protein